MSFKQPTASVSGRQHKNVQRLIYCLKYFNNLTSCEPTTHQLQSTTTLWDEKLSKSTIFKQQPSVYNIIQESYHLCQPFLPHHLFPPPSPAHFPLLVLGVPHKQRRVPVHSIGVVVVEIGDSFLQFGRPGRLLNGQDEQLNVGVQRKLVHGIDTSHVIEDEEKCRRSLGTRSVTLGNERGFWKLHVFSMFYIR